MSSSSSRKLLDTQGTDATCTCGGECLAQGSPGLSCCSCKQPVTSCAHGGFQLYIGQCSTACTHTIDSQQSHLSSSISLLVLIWRWLCHRGSALNALLLLSLDRQCHCGRGEHVYL
jgi:hypothetical protein